MIGLLCFGLAILISPFRSKSRLEAENAVLRHQLIVLRRKMRGRPQLTNNDRWFFIQLYRWFPSILQVLTIIRPDTLVRWHRAGFRRYWRWKSRPRGGRPQIETELRVLELSYLEYLKRQIFCLPLAGLVVATIVNTIHLVVDRESQRIST